ncbi:MAG: quinolinate synthase NadA [Deltaproteobacteria bacterium]|jgi:quinolinate synthase|nr:quinolinate synthase NadA [Deltaproteobacteria bacterium]
MKSDRKRRQARRVIELKEILGAEILSHFYQRADVKELSDLVGGSRAVLRRAAVSSARVLVVCGVDFMVRAVARLRPDIPVVAPRPDALCPFSAAAGPETVLAARRAFPGRRLAAGMKAREDVIALCDADLSLDAARDASLDPPLRSAAGGLGGVPGAAAGLSGSFPLRIAPRAGSSRPAGPPLPGGGARHGQPCPAVPPAGETAVLPGLDLEASGTPGRDAYGGLAPVCAIHAQVEAAEAGRARLAWPGAVLGANAMCSPEVRAACDFSGDADALARFVASSASGEFVLFCEAGLAETLARAFPARTFRETETEMFCPNMKLTNVKDVLRSLEGLIPAFMPEGMAARGAVGLHSGMGEPSGGPSGGAGDRPPDLPDALAARAVRAAMEAQELMDAAGGGLGPGGGTS